MLQNLATFVYFTKITAVTYSIINIIPVSIVLDEVTEQNIVTQIDDSTEEILTQCGKLGGAAVLQVRELEY